MRLRLRRCLLYIYIYIYTRKTRGGALKRATYVFLGSSHLARKLGCPRCFSARGASLPAVLRCPRCFSTRGASLSAVIASRSASLPAVLRCPRCFTALGASTILRRHSLKYLPSDLICVLIYSASIKCFCYTICIKKRSGHHLPK